MRPLKKRCPNIIEARSLGVSPRYRNPLKIGGYRGLVVNTSAILFRVVVMILPPFIVPTIVYIKKAERVGFEPTVTKGDTRSPGAPDRPLQHLSAESNYAN